MRARVTHVRALWRPQRAIPDKVRHSSDTAAGKYAHHGARRNRKLYSQVHVVLVRSYRYLARRRRNDCQGDLNVVSQPELNLLNPRRLALLACCAIALPHCTDRIKPCQLLPFLGEAPRVEMEDQTDTSKLGRGQS